jgi:hypothetical protein
MLSPNAMNDVFSSVRLGGPEPPSIGGTSPPESGGGVGCVGDPPQAAAMAARHARAHSLFRKLYM